MTAKKPDGRINNGGARKGSGRPKKEPTVTVSFRIKPDQVEPVREAVKKITSKSSRSKRKTTAAL